MHMEHIVGAHCKEFCSGLSYGCLCAVQVITPLFVLQNPFSHTSPDFSWSKGKEEGCEWGSGLYYVSGVYTSREGNEKQLFVCLEFPGCCSLARGMSEKVLELT